MPAIPPTADDNAWNTASRYTPWSQYCPVVFSAPSATNTGAVTAAMNDRSAGNTCEFAPTPRMISVAAAGANPVTPPGVSFPHGLFEFTAQRCQAGGTISMKMTYPAPLPPGTRYWKWGPEPGNTTPHGYVMPATISGNTITFAIKDGGQGDDDLLANGTIVDQGGPGVPTGATGGEGVAAVPTLGEWGLLLLAALLGVLGVRARRAA